MENDTKIKDLPRNGPQASGGAASKKATGGNNNDEAVEESAPRPFASGVSDHSDRDAEEDSEDETVSDDEEGLLAPPNEDGPQTCVFSAIKKRPTTRPNHLLEYTVGTNLTQDLEDELPRASTAIKPKKKKASKKREMKTNPKKQEPKPTETSEGSKKQNLETNGKSTKGKRPEKTQKEPPKDIDKSASILAEVMGDETPIKFQHRDWYTGTFASAIRNGFKEELHHGAKVPVGGSFFAKHLVLRNPKCRTGQNEFTTISTELFEKQVPDVQGVINGSREDKYKLQLADGTKAHFHVCFLVERGE